MNVDKEKTPFQSRLSTQLSRQKKGVFVLVTHTQSMLV